MNRGEGKSMRSGEEMGNIEERGEEKEQQVGWAREIR